MASRKDRIDERMRKARKANAENPMHRCARCGCMISKGYERWADGEPMHKSCLFKSAYEGRQKDG